MTQNKKTETINIRVSKEQKNSLRKAAQNAGMNISKYLMNLAVNGKIVIVEGGKELAAEIYELNHHLNQMEKYPFVDVQTLRNTVSEGIKNINQAKEGI